MRRTLSLMLGLLILLAGSSLAWLHQPAAAQRPPFARDLGEDTASDEGDDSADESSNTKDPTTVTSESVSSTFDAKDNINYIKVIDYPENLDVCLQNGDTNCISQALLDDNYRAHCATTDQIYSAKIGGPYQELVAKGLIGPGQITTVNELELALSDFNLFGGLKDEDSTTAEGRMNSLAGFTTSPSINEDPASDNELTRNLTSGPWSSMMNTVAQCEAQITALKEKKQLCDKFNFQNSKFISLLSNPDVETQCAENQVLTNTTYKALDLLADIENLQTQGVDCEALTSTYKEVSPVAQSALTSYAQSKGLTDGQAAQSQLKAALAAVPIGNSESYKIAVLVVMNESVPDGFSVRQNAFAPIRDFFASLFFPNQAQPAAADCVSDQRGYCYQFAFFKVPAINLIDENPEPTKQDALSQTSGSLIPYEQQQHELADQAEKKTNIKQTASSFASKSAVDGTRKNVCLNCDDPLSKAMADIIEADLAIRPEKLNCGTIKQNPEEGQLISYDASIKVQDDVPLVIGDANSGFLGTFQTTIGQPITSIRNTLANILHIGGDAASPEVNPPVKQKMYLIMPYDPFEGRAVKNTEMVTNSFMNAKQIAAYEEEVEKAKEDYNPAYTDSLVMKDYNLTESTSEQKYAVGCEGDIYQRDEAGRIMFDVEGNALYRDCSQSVTYSVGISEDKNQKPEARPQIHQYSEKIRSLTKKIGAALFPSNIAAAINKITTGERYLAMRPTGSDPTLDPSTTTCNDFSTYTAKVPSGDAEVKTIIRRVAANNSDIFDGNTALLEKLLYGIFQIESGFRYRQMVCGSGGSQISCGDLKSSALAFGPMQHIPQQCSPTNGNPYTPAQICELEPAIEATANRLREFKKYRAIKDAPKADQPYLMAGRYHGLVDLNPATGDWIEGAQFSGPKCQGAPAVSGCNGLNYCECAVDGFSMSDNMCDIF